VSNLRAFIVIWFENGAERLFQEGVSIKFIVPMVSFRLSDSLIVRSIGWSKPPQIRKRLKHPLGACFRAPCPQTGSDRVVDERFSMIKR
jgi:hypothetical protein